MLSNSYVFILLILVKHFTLFWLIVLTGAVALHATSSTIDAVDVTTDTSTASLATVTSGSASNLANSFDHYKNAVDSVANARKRKNANTIAAKHVAAGITTSSTTRQSNSAAANAIRPKLQLHNNGSHFTDDNVTKLYGPSTQSTPSISASIFQATKTDAPTMSPAPPSAQTRTLSKLKLPDLSSKNKSFIDNSNSNSKKSNSASVAIDRIGNGHDSSQSHNHNVNNRKNRIENISDDNRAADDEHRPQADSPPVDSPTSYVPEFPQRNDAVYFIVAVAGGAKIWSRTLARTLVEMGPPFAGPLGPPLRPLYIDLPTNGRFSVKVLQSLCEQTEKRPLAGLVVIGNGQAARAISLAGTSMQLPVLWAKGGVANLHGTTGEVYSPMQTLLQPSAHEILKAIRALFLQTHWHSFFVLSDVHATTILAANKGNPLKEPPLVPTILPLPRTNDDVFKQLAQISRSTRGVVLMLCELQATRRIMSEAQRLNMVGGHFIWLWADTTSSTEFFDALHSPDAVANNFGPTMLVNDTVAKPVKMNNRDVKGESATVHTTRATVKPSANGTANVNATRPSPIAMRPEEVDRGKTTGAAERIDMDRVEEENFSAGFDPFRLKQRQYDKSSRQERFGQMREKPLPANGLILGLYGGASEQHRLGDDSGAKKSRRNIHGDGDDGNGGEHIFVSNQTNTNSVSSRHSSSDERNRNFSAHDVNSLDYSIDNNTFNENPFKLKKRTSIPSAATNHTNNSSSSSTSSSPFVVYHKFEDFPVGLLALRPQRMNVDRHFIRATVRVFAATWAKIDAESKRHKYQSTVINAAAGRSTGSTSRNTKNDRRQYERQMRRKRNIGTANDLLAAAVAIQVNTSSQRQQSNANVGNNLIRSNSSDLSANANARIILNDRHVNSNGNISNQNSSGLTRQSSTKSNNDRNVNAVHGVDVSRMDAIVSAARNASEAIRRNYLFDASLRSRSNKRQNTWWALEKETPEHQRHLPDANADENAAAAACDTPRYLGGCYGTANKQDVKNAEHFASALREASISALCGQRIHGSIETALTATFELLNSVPVDKLNPLKSANNQEKYDRSAAGDGVDGGAAEHDYNKRPADTSSPPDDDEVLSKWRRVGSVSASSVRLDTIIWPGGDIVVSGLSARARSVFRVVTALAPPFVMESELDEDGLCLRGLPCHFLSPSGRHHNLTLMFNAIETRDRLEEDAEEHGDLPPEPEHLDEKIYHETKCCYGMSMDLLENIATELGFEFHLYVVRDQLFGAKKPRSVHDHLANGKQSVNQQSPSSPPTATHNANYKSWSTDGRHQINHADAGNLEQWNGIIGDLVNGSADMSFAPLSVSKSRAEVIDFSVPYFHSGVSFLASPKSKSKIPLLAFLLPFSPELWIAIFTSLNITAVAVAVYEWLSPFGLNPWGRQRSKNFSLSSALWVMWGLLCGHLVAFKAPKSWPNKFLINVWGGFSVIFVASYTANIAALIAGLFFHRAAGSYDTSLTTQRVGAPIASAAESYVQNKDSHLWDHMKKYALNHIEDGIRGLKNGTLDLLMADSPILDYYRATDSGCTLQRIGDTFVEDTYAIGMVKGFPLKESISALIAKYSSNGYLDILTEKWYGGLPCFKFEAEIVQPRPLGIEAVAGVFLLLGMGMVMGVIILIFEHWFYKFILPSLRLKPKGTIWKSRNIMFFSQKLYRFINCVELVSPHHAARELVHSIRQGQIASLFQKSIKRKEDEQRRRRKSKAQFFEMIQEIRRAQQVERENIAAIAEVDASHEGAKSPPSIFRPKASPKPRLFSALKKDGRSRSNSSVLGIRRFSTDSILGDRMDSIGRRLSRDLTNSPPDLGHRFDAFGKGDVVNKYDTISCAKLATTTMSKSNEILSNRYDTFSGKNFDKSDIPVKLKKPGKRPKISFESYHRDDQLERGDEREYELPPVKEGLEPPMCQEDRSTAILRHKLHTELLSKYPPVSNNNIHGNHEATASATSQRPPLPKRNVKYQHQRQKSLDNLDVRNGSSNTMKTSPLTPKHSSADSKSSPRSQISVDRLSREDLLRLSHSSQSEIHEYLKNSLPQRPAEPP